MPNLSINNVSETLLARLQGRARQNHRSLQEELLAILEAAAPSMGLTIAELHRQINELGVRTGDDSTTIIREDRDAR